MRPFTRLALFALATWLAGAGLGVAQQTTRSVWVSDGSGNALTSTGAGSARALHFVWIDPSTGSPITLSSGRVPVDVFGVSQSASTFLTVRLTDGSSYLTPGQDYTHDAALTMGSAAGPLIMGRASASAPTAVSADNDAVAAWFTREGAQVVTVARCGDPAAVQSLAISTNAAQTTQLVAAQTGQTIYVCGWNVMAAGTTNVTLVAGTGTNCGTGQTSLTGAYPLTAQTGLALANAGAPQLRAPVSNALCLTNSAAVQVSGSLTYVRF
jgi:hypothetical protein